MTIEPKDPTIAALEAIMGDFTRAEPLALQLLAIIDALQVDGASELITCEVFQDTPFLLTTVDADCMAKRADATLKLIAQYIRYKGLYRVDPNVTGLPVVDEALNGDAAHFLMCLIFMGAISLNEWRKAQRAAAESIAA